MEQFQNPLKIVEREQIDTSNTLIHDHPRNSFAYKR